jgi:hypothetical protein
LYAQDTWKITHKLTMNYGLRYDDEAGAFRGGFIAGPNGTCFQGNRIIPACSSDKNNFQPRLGFTYAPWQHWLLKASFAETTDSLNFDGATLNTVTIDKTTAAGLAVLAAFPNAPSTTLLAPFAPGGTNFGRVRPISDHLRNPEMRSVNFGIQHEFTRTLVGEIQYIGQFGFGLFGERDVNYPVIAANLLLDSGKVTDRSAARWFANDLTVGFLGQLQSGRPYPVSTGTAGFASERFFGVGNETQQRPNVLADGTLSTAGIASSTGSNLLIGPGGVAACIASGQPAALCNSIQNAFLAPVGASALGAVDSLTGHIVDFQFLNGNVGRDAGRGVPFCRLDVSLQKIFKLARAEKVSFELRADAFNIFNHTNFQGFNSNDVLAVLGLSLDSVTHAPKSNFFTCRSCMRPDGTYVGASGQVLHLSDLQHGKVSKDLIKPVFGGIGDPATADIPRTLQLSFHVRF